MILELTNDFQVSSEFSSFQRIFNFLKDFQNSITTTAHLTAAAFVKLTL